MDDTAGWRHFVRPLNATLAVLGGMLCAMALYGSASAEAACQGHCPDTYQGMTYAGCTLELNQFDVVVRRICSYTSSKIIEDDYYDYPYIMVE